MFKNFASDALGLSDIGKIIPPSQFNQTDIDDYIFHEDNERIYFVIKSKMDEYCFTNTAFIHLDGQSATSKKRMLNAILIVILPQVKSLLRRQGRWIWTWN